MLLVHFHSLNMTLLIFKLFVRLPVSESQTIAVDPQCFLRFFLPVANRQDSETPLRGKKSSH